MLFRLGDQGRLLREVLYQWREYIWGRRIPGGVNSSVMALRWEHGVSSGGGKRKGERRNVGGDEME